MPQQEVAYPENGDLSRRGRWYERELKVKGWESEDRTVQRLLNHLARKTGSESSRRSYLDTLARLCRREGKSPLELVRLRKSEAEDAVQSYLDSMLKAGVSKAWIKSSMAHLVAFFRANGFKKARELDVEGYHVPSRYRKRAEYVPLPSEIAKMVVAGRDPYEKAAVLFVYESGLRNSTARAVRYGDVRGEMDAGLEVVQVPVRVGMKEVDPDAAKGSVEYTAFVGREGVKALKEHVKALEGRIGALPEAWPLFPGRSMDGSPMKKTTLQHLVKRLAKRAGVERWRDVYPHCLRKAFENAVRNSGMDWKDQEILMGHILPGSMDTYADKTRVEEFRGKHAKVRFFPEGTVTRNEMLHAMRGEILALAGYSEGEVKGLGELSRFTKEEMDGLIQRKWRERRPEQKVVSSAEVRGCLGEGWEFVTWLDQGRGEAVVRRPR